MKILFLTDEFPPKSVGGAGVVAHYLAKGLQKHGHRLYIITVVQKKTEEKKLEFNGLTVYQIYAKHHPRWNSYLCLYNPQTILKVKEIIKEIKPDIVHAHSIYRYFSYYSLKIAKKYAKAVFLTTHDVMLIHYGKLMPQKGKDIYRISVWDQIKAAKKRYNPFRNIIARHYLKYVDKIFAVSKSLKNVLEINGIKNIETIYNGIDVNDWKINKKEVNKFKRKYNLQNKKVIFFSVRLSGAKGRDVILKTMVPIIKEVENVVLVIAGKVDAFSKKAIDPIKADLIKKFNVKKHIIFTGWLEGAELKSAYYGADVCVVPSICFDSFPTANLEAMAVKKPIVGTCFGGTSEIVLDPAQGGAGAQTGYIVNPNNIEWMSEKIIDLLKNPEKAKKFGKSGYERVKKEFSLDKQVKKTLKWYK